MYVVRVHVACRPCFCQSSCGFSGFLLGQVNVATHSPASGQNPTVTGIPVPLEGRALLCTHPARSPVRAECPEMTVSGRVKRGAPRVRAETFIPAGTAPAQNNCSLRDGKQVPAPVPDPPAQSGLESCVLWARSGLTSRPAVRGGRLRRPSGWQVPTRGRGQHRLWMPAWSQRFLCDHGPRA